MRAHINLGDPFPRHPSSVHFPLYFSLPPLSLQLLSRGPDFFPELQTFSPSENQASESSSACRESLPLMENLKNAEVLRGEDEEKNADFNKG